jgi:uncharacterized protein (DUF58 family)
VKDAIQIRPTKQALILGGILFAMWMGAVNHANNLAYLVLFLVFGIALVSLIHTHRNLTGVEVAVGRIFPAFAGGDLRLSLIVRNATALPLWMLRVDSPDFSWSGGGARVAHVRAEGEEAVEAVVSVPRRGIFRIDGLRVSSLYPVGLAQAERRSAAVMEWVVYPQPSGNRPFPEPERDAVKQDDGHFKGGDYFYGVRPYQTGESQRHIDWKAVARGRPLMVKEFAGGGTGRVWLDWRYLHGMETEARLSQLAQWIVQADPLGAPYGLRLPSLQIEPGTGPAHFHRCLRALAAFGGGEK